MIVVPALLEKGDVVLRVGVKSRVYKVDENFVYLRALYAKGAEEKTIGYGTMVAIGINSKEKMELIRDCDFGMVENIGKNMVTKSSQ